MKQLGQSALSTGSGSLIYTVPTGFRAVVRDIFIANTTASPIELSLHIVASGVAVGTSNAIMKSVDIPGNTTIHWCGNQSMTAGGFIQGIGSASGLTVTISGDESRIGGGI